MAQGLETDPADELILVVGLGCLLGASGPISAATARSSYVRPRGSWIATFTGSTGHTGVLGQYKFAAGNFAGLGLTLTCYELEGTLGTRRPKQEGGSRLIINNYHEYKGVPGWNDPCPWQHLQQLR